MHCIALYPGSFLGKSLGARGVTNHWTEVDWTGLDWTGLTKNVRNKLINHRK